MGSQPVAQRAPLANDTWSGLQPISLQESMKAEDPSLKNAMTSYTLLSGLWGQLSPPINPNPLFSQMVIYWLTDSSRCHKMGFVSWNSVSLPQGGEIQPSNLSTERCHKEWHISTQTQRYRKQIFPITQDWPWTRRSARCKPICFVTRGKMVFSESVLTWPLKGHHPFALSFVSSYFSSFPYIPPRRDRSVSTSYTCFKLRKMTILA